jgi:Xaa-Pro dipeptidase
MSRLAELTGRANANGLDGVVLMPGPNLQYISGLSFHLSERPILALFPSQGTPAIVLPALEAGRVQSAACEMNVFAYTDEEGHRGATQAACAALELADCFIGIEALRMRVLEERLLERYAPDCRLVPAETVLSQLRMRKDKDEIDQMRRAAVLTERALTSTMRQVRAGMTEKQVASLLTIELLRAGGEAMAFPPTVLAGENAATPHATSGERAISRGETIVVDCGVSVGGYLSDLTRTFVIGGLEPDISWIYEVVLMANAAAQAAVKPGVPAGVIDQTARAVIEEAGYGEHFTHLTGHGLGLEVHEPPYIVAGNREPLEPGMTFTIEPGIYLPGRAGVRIEDDIVVTETGAETLTTYPRRLRSL